MIYTCITGATSGIGKACAYHFAAQGHNIILIGRRQERLETIQKEIIGLYGVDVRLGSIDVRESSQVKEFFADLHTQGVQIDILINNAGLAKGFASVMDLEIDDMHTMIDINIKGVLITSKFAIPLMQGVGKHIFSIGSVSAKSPYKGGATYCATKAAVNIISECMRLELQANNIYVTCINPGLVDTEFQYVRTDGDQQLIDNFFVQRLGNGKQLNPESIAQLIYETIGRNIPEITYWHQQS